jgi:hypothetical protein
VARFSSLVVVRPALVGCVQPSPFVLVTTAENSLKRKPMRCDTPAYSVVPTHALSDSESGLRLPSLQRSSFNQLPPLSAPLSGLPSRRLALDAICGLRGAASVCVVCGTFFTYWLRVAVTDPFPVVAWDVFSPVTLFFVLSGYGLGTCPFSSPRTCNLVRFFTPILCRVSPSLPPDSLDLRH